MKKDIDKLLNESLQTYYFLLLIIVIIKLLGGNYFNIIQTNQAIITINNFIMYWKLENIWYTITLFIYLSVILSITCHDNTVTLYKYCLKSIIFVIIIQYLKNYIGIWGIVLDYSYLFILGLIYLKKHKKQIKRINVINYITIMVMYTVLQLCSMLIRNQSIYHIVDNFYINFILNLDVLLSMLIIQKLYFMKGVDNLCQMVVSYGLHKLILLKKLPKRLHIKLQNRKKFNKEEKITYAIYMPLYIIWNLFTMFIIYCIATLNNAMIETLFITIAFWLNKRSFGKPFHFKKVITCFCFSSIVYYVLTRVTVSIQTSIFIPIFLGVLLSYITSHFIIKDNVLYKGMPEELFYKTIRQVTNNELTIKMCKEFYCDRLTDAYISMINNYSCDTVRKKRQKINAKLKDL